MKLDDPDNILGPIHSVHWRAALEFKPRDLWVGAYWKRIGNCIDLWICLLPCLPIHVSWRWSREK